MVWAQQLLLKWSGHSRFYYSGSKQPVRPAFGI